MVHPKGWEKREAGQIQGRKAVLPRTPLTSLEFLVVTLYLRPQRKTQDFWFQRLSLACLPLLIGFFSPFIPYFHNLLLERCQNTQIIGMLKSRRPGLRVTGAAKSADFWGFSADFRFQRISPTVKEIRLDLYFPKFLTLIEGSISSLGMQLWFNASNCLGCSCLS